MSKSHFAIEPPRKIRISIEGYDAHARTQAQQRKLQQRRRRLARKAAAAAPTQPKPAANLVAAVPTQAPATPSPPAAPAAPAAELSPDTERQLREALS